MTTDKKVKDYMIPLADYPHVKASETLHDAIATLLTQITTGREGSLDYGMLLVLNDRNQLVGSLRIADVLRGLGPGLFGEGAQKFEGLKAELPNLAVLWEETFFKDCKGHGSRVVKDFVTPFQTLVKADDPILKAVHIMMTKHMTSVPAVEGDKVIGVVRLKELFVAICEMCSL